MTEQAPNTRSRFLALELATSTAASCLSLLRGLRGDLADQVSRAVSSVALNLAEGSGRFGRDRTHHFRIAYGSAMEASTGLAILKQTGALNAANAQRILDNLDRIRAMTWRAMNPRK